jgi:hypothetical protein
MRSYSFILATYPFRGFIALLTRMVILLCHKKVILVFGMSRSGTSMLSKFISLTASSIYMHEPETEIMKERYGRDRMFTQQAFWDFVYSEDQKDFKVHSLVCMTLLAVLKSSFSIRTICIKPISLNDVMEECDNALKNASVVYICRHPAGRSESILRQLKLDQNIDAVSNEDLETIGREWGRTNRTVQMWFQRHPAWQWVFFEKLANDPLVEFKKLYKKLNLAWDENVQNHIQQMTTGEDGGYYNVKRNSRSQAEKWRGALTEDQVESIRKGCLPFETNLYESF